MRRRRAVEAAAEAAVLAQRAAERGERSTSAAAEASGRVEAVLLSAQRTSLEESRRSRVRQLRIILPLTVVTALAALLLYPQRLPVQQPPGLHLDADLSFTPESVRLKIGVPDESGFTTVDFTAYGDNSDPPRERPVLLVTADYKELVACPTGSSCDLQGRPRKGAVEIKGSYEHTPPEEGSAFDYATFTFFVAPPGHTVELATNGSTYAGLLPDVALFHQIPAANGPGVEQEYTGQITMQVAHAATFPLLTWNDPKPDVYSDDFLWNVDAGRRVLVGGSDENVVQRDQRDTFMAGAFAGLAGGGMVAVVQVGLTPPGEPRKFKKSSQSRRRLSS